MLHHEIADLATLFALTAGFEGYAKGTQKAIRMKIKLLSSALEDLYDGRLFYEKQGEGLGEYFNNSQFSDIDSLTLHAGIHPKFFGYYRMLSKRFPYAIYYKIEEGSLVVVWRVRGAPERIHRRTRRAAPDGNFTLLHCRR